MTPGGVRVTFNEAALRRLLDSQTGPVAQHLLRLGYQVEAAAKGLAPVQTGRLAGSISTVMRGGAGGLEVRVGTNVEYAIYVHEGTRPHVIRPRNARVLRFTTKSGVVFAQSVNHPGTKGTKFLVDALRVMR